jgi:hypothetical protein
MGLSSLAPSTRCRAGPGGPDTPGLKPKRTLPMLGRMRCCPECATEIEDDLARICQSCRCLLDGGGVSARESDGRGERDLPGFP